MKRVLAVKNITCETLGTLEGLFRADGYEIETANAQDGIPAKVADYSAIVILGGPMAVYDNFPYLQREQELIRDAMKNNVPTLGICLGSQLIAQAAGGKVYKGKHKEIGWHMVSLTPQGQNSIFAGASEKEIKVFQWHGDTYDLPPNATILARSSLYPQAFQIGSAVGIQFHLEVDESLIRAWIKEYENEVKAEKMAEGNILAPRQDFESLAKKCQLVYRNFARIVR
ncbi:MAG: type 1 glutamine amidotransferase [Nitrososphaera sp.]